ncbi:5-guanidino-2-oxopentanoate decarboxylase [Rhodovibrionaceae bacterium A322]
MKSVGVALIEMLEHLGTEYVFGIPGVHTIELYRGLAASAITHITPRHEQGAGFMADGYARVSGKPGVCFLITGPGLTNAITAMAQAHQDSIPMLVISGVNNPASWGRKKGLLHELPQQHEMIRTLTPHAYSLSKAEDLPGLLQRAFEVFASERPGPVHIEIPLELMAQAMPAFELPTPSAKPAHPDQPDLDEALSLLSAAQNPIILAGGGCRGVGAEIMEFAHKLGAPVITTTNARSYMGADPLHVPASASIPPVREAISQSDVVLALGTELGQTDYDVYARGDFPHLDCLIRVDLDAEMLAQGPACRVALEGAVGPVLAELSAGLQRKPAQGAAERSSAILRETEDDLDAAMLADLDVMDRLIELLPGCIMVGDSTQVVYAGNFLHRAGIPAGWFNSATGYGTLGYAPPAAVGAALANPEAPVVCLVGDGGLQFSIAELGAAVDAGTEVIFLVWNNGGYKEIETHMRAAQVSPIGVTPTPPDMEAIAQAFGLSYHRAAALPELEGAVKAAIASPGPAVLECLAPTDSSEIPRWTKGFQAVEG